MFIKPLFCGVSKCNMYVVVLVPGMAGRARQTRGPQGREDLEQWKEIRRDQNWDGSLLLVVCFMKKERKRQRKREMSQAPSLFRPSAIMYFCGGVLFYIINIIFSLASGIARQGVGAGRDPPVETGTVPPHPWSRE